MTFKIAFYKGKGLIGNRLIKWWCRGQYSHCEMIFSDGITAAATITHGVHMQLRSYDHTEWDFIELPASLEAKARQWFVDHEGKAYDYLGDIRFIFDFIPASKDKWFCSSACAAALGFEDAWRYDPNALAATLHSLAVI
jgi:hypothetical protein